MMADGGLIRYLYGTEEAGIWDQGGQFRVETRAIKEHTVGDKTIPSGFFSQPEAQHISAVLFTNCGSNAKFSRMGYQHGVGCDVFSMARVGYCFNPDVMGDPTFFLYNLDGPPLVESWGQGLVVLHNPNALKPLPKEFFVDALESHFKEGALRSYSSHWAPTFIPNLNLISRRGEAEEIYECIQADTIRSRSNISGTIPGILWWIRSSRLLRGEWLVNG